MPPDVFVLGGSQTDFAKNYSRENKDIAARLGISPKTAQVHRDNLKQKLKAKSTAAIVRYAIKHKLIRAELDHAGSISRRTP